jgi:hypothetical protein
MWIFPHSTKTGLFISCLFQCNSRLKPLHLNTPADSYVSHGIWSLSLQCSDDQSLLYSGIHLTTSHEVMRLQLFSGRPKNTKDVHFTGCAVIFPAFIILGNACIETLVVHLFLNLIKSVGCMWPRALWMCKYSTLPHSRAYVVFPPWHAGHLCAGTGTHTEFNTEILNPACMNA